MRIHTDEDGHDNDYIRALHVPIADNRRLDLALQGLAGEPLSLKNAVINAFLNREEAFQKGRHLQGCTRHDNQPVQGQTQQLQQS